MSSRSRKGLGNGVPIGTCMAAGDAATLFKPGSHGSTFGGNPLACAAGLATLSIIEDDGLMRNAVAIGDFIREGLRDRLSGLAGVRDIRGVGLMIGIELAVPCGELVARALEAGLLINVTADTVVRLLPPLIYTRQEAQLVIDKLAPLIVDFLAEQGASGAAPARSAVCVSRAFQARSAWRCGIFCSSGTSAATSSPTCSSARAGSRSASSATSPIGRCTIARSRWCSRNIRRARASPSKRACTSWAAR